MKLTGIFLICSTLLAMSSACAHEDRTNQTQRLSRGIDDRRFPVTSSALFDFSCTEKSLRVQVRIEGLKLDKGARIAAVMVNGKLIGEGVLARFNQGLPKAGALNRVEMACEASSLYLYAFFNIYSNTAVEESASVIQIGSADYQ